MCYNNKECVPLDHVCDGSPDCTDSSDEAFCRKFSPGARLLHTGKITRTKYFVKELNIKILQKPTL